MTFLFCQTHNFKMLYTVGIIFVCNWNMYFHISDQHGLLYTDGAALGFCGGPNAETERGQRLFHSSPEAIQLLTAVREATQRHHCTKYLTKDS